MQPMTPTSPMALKLAGDDGIRFGLGDYQPLEASGPRAGNLIAFSRTIRGDTAVAVAPRLVASFLDGGRLPPEVFAETVLPVTGRFVDVFTGEEQEGALRVDRLFSTLPVALLLRR